MILTITVNDAAEEVQGETFTITNIRSVDAFSSPIVNCQEVGNLGVYKITNTDH